MADSTQRDTAARTPARPIATSAPPANSTPPKFNSTPFSRKLVGNPSTKKSLKHIRMDPALKEELAESDLTDVPGLVEHLFPDSSFPTSLADIEKAVYEEHAFSGGWMAFDPTKDTGATAAPGVRETALAKFLNKVVKTILATVPKSNRNPAHTKRKWSSKSQNPLRQGPNAKRKPDICLVEERKPLTWLTVLAILELKSSAKERTDAYVQLVNSAYMIFSTQDERRFFIGVSVCASDVRVYVFDRSGVVCSSEFDLSGKETPLVRLIAGLALCDASGIGLDATIRHALDGSRFVNVDNIEYQIIKPLFISDSIRGRGTTCWHARRDDVDYVVKDTWTDVSRIQTEAEILTAAGKTQDVSELIAHEIVQTNGMNDSTANIRSIIGDIVDYSRKEWYENIEVRVHRRLVTTPLAEGLTNFRSKKELLQVLICAIKAHRRLVEKHILHRDISINNVMIQRLSTPIEIEASSTSSTPLPEQDSSSESSSSSSDENLEENKFVRGILIDLDYALITQDKDGKKFERTSDPTGHRTGTVPFMSTEILMGLAPGQEHQAHHDLESFFYILLWIALNYAGPCNVERQDMNVEIEDPIKGWLDAKSIQQLGINKYGSMESSDNFFNLSVTSKFTLYFRDLIPCILELRRALFRTNAGEDRSKLTHQDIIDILKKPLTWLPDDDNWSRKNDEAGYGPIGKRKFDDIQEEAEGEGEEMAALGQGGQSPTNPKKAKTSATEREKKPMKVPTFATRRSNRERFPNPRYKS